MLEDLPREKLAFLPTPMHKLENLGDSLGLTNLWIKRDDLTGISFGGNKTRKLEYVIGEAMVEGADTVVTVGGVQSNHCRQTAAVAAKAGLRCILLLAGEEPETSTGNHLIDKLYGAEIKYFPDDNVLEMNSKLDAILETLTDFGLTPFAIPAGGMMPSGTLGYVNAMVELKDQMANSGIEFDKIILAAGTGGTQAGMILGAQAADLDVEIIGISIISKKDELEQRIRDLIDRTVDKYPSHFNPFKPSISIDDSFLGEGYGIMSSGVVSAIEMFAKMDAILLDPVYTGKAGLALMRMAMAGNLHPDNKTLFWHTGGSPEIFTHVEEFFT